MSSTKFILSWIKNYFKSSSAQMHVKEICSSLKRLHVNSRLITINPLFTASAKPEENFTLASSQGCLAILFFLAALLFWRWYNVSLYVISSNTDHTSPTVPLMPCAPDRDLHRAYVSVCMSYLVLRLWHATLRASRARIRASWSSVLATYFSRFLFTEIFVVVYLYIYLDNCIHMYSDL